MIQEALTTNPPSHEATARQVNTNEQQFLADGFCFLDSCEFVFIRGLMLRFLSVTSGACPPWRVIRGLPRPEASTLRSTATEVLRRTGQRRRVFKRFPNFPCNLRPNFRLYICNCNNNPASTKKGKTMNPLTQFKKIPILPLLIALSLVARAAGAARAAISDFNGDGHPDYVVQNANTHQTAIWYLNNNVFISGAYGPTLPAGWSLVGP